MLKYKLTKEKKKFFGKTLYRIEALKDFGNVKKGDLGGFVESTKNLSQEGDCWIYDNAIVCDNAKVYDNTKVWGNARVYDYAIVGDNARVYNKARVCDNARVFGDAEVCDNARVFGDAEIGGNAIVWRYDRVSDKK